MEQPIRFVESPNGHLGGHRAWVTERTGGVSRYPAHSLNLGSRVGDDPANVVENERRVLARLGLTPPARAVLVHGIAARVVEAPGLVEETDALLTRTDGLALALTVADCFPLALVAGSWRALAHCGWRGVAGGIVEEVLQVLRHLGESAESTRAWIGPGIGVCCYEVGEEVTRNFPSSASTSPSTPVPGQVTASHQGRSSREECSPAGSARRPHLDLAGDIVRRLRAGGLAQDAILAAGLCTSCNTDRFFSHRAEGPTGRMSAYLL